MTMITIIMMMVYDDNDMTTIMMMITLIYSGPNKQLTIKSIGEEK